MSNQKQDKKVETEDKKIEVSQKDLKELLDSNKQLQEDIKRLNAVADVGRLDRYDKLTEEDKGKVIRLRSIDGKIIISWSSMVVNIVEQVDKYWREDQQVEVTYEDGEKQIMPYVQFSRRYVSIDAKVKSEKKLTDPKEIEKNGEVVFELVTDDGKEYEIGSLFVN